MTAYKLRCHKCDDADYPDAGELIDHLRTEHGDLFEITDEAYDTPYDAISELQALDVMSDALLFSAEAEIGRWKNTRGYWVECPECESTSIRCHMCGFVSDGPAFLHEETP